MSEELKRLAVLWMNLLAAADAAKDVFWIAAEGSDLEAWSDKAAGELYRLFREVVPAVERAGYTVEQLREADEARVREANHAR